MMVNNSQIIIYQAQNGETKLNVSFNEETVWLTQKQMATLFGKSIATINEHIKNIFKEDELEKVNVLRKFGNSEFMQKPIIKDWAKKLDTIIYLNGRKLLNHTGKITPQKAVDK